MWHCAGDAGEVTPVHAPAAPTGAQPMRMHPVVIAGIGAGLPAAWGYGSAVFVCIRDSGRLGAQEGRFLCSVWVAFWLAGWFAVVYAWWLVV